MVDQLPNASYFNKILGPETLKRLNSTEAMTLFLPIDDAWKSLDPYERLYLESEFAADDLNRILNMHAVVEETVKWSDSFGKKGITREYNKASQPLTPLTIGQSPLWMVRSWRLK